MINSDCLLPRETGDAFDQLVMTHITHGRCVECFVVVQHLVDTAHSRGGPNRGGVAEQLQTNGVF